MNQVNKVSEKQSLKNILYIWGNRLLLILTPIITTPIIINYFGLDVAGIWFLASIFASQLMLLEIGISTSLVRLLARDNIVNNIIKTKQIITTAFWTLLMLSAFILTLMSVISNFFLTAFDISFELQTDARRLIKFAIISVAINLPLRIGYSILASRHYFDKVQVIDTLGIITRLFGVIFIFTFFSPSLFILGIIIFGSSNLVSFLTFIKARKLLEIKFLDFSYKYFSFESWKLVTSLSAASFFVSLAGIFLLQFSSTLVGYFLELRYVSIMAIPIMIYNSLTPFFQAIPTISSPIAAGVTNKGEKENLKNQFFTYSRYTASIGLLSVLGMLTAGKPLLVLWLGSETVTNDDIYQMLDILIIIFLSYAFGSIAPLGRSVLMSTGFHWRIAYLELFSTLIGILIGSLLMLYLEMGALGMSYGIGITLILRGFIFYPKILAFYFETNLFEVIKNSILSSLIVYFFLFIALNMLDLISIFSSSKLFLELFEFTILFLMWCELNYFYILSKEHRLQINEHIKKRFPKNETN